MHVHDFWWIDASFCTDIHGCQTHATMRMTFVVLSEMPQQLLDGLPAIRLGTDILVSPQDELQNVW